MASTEQTIRLYQDLAYIYVQQGQAQMRDRFLVLAVDAAYSAGKADDAEKLRQRLLQVNPHHLFKPFRTVADAMKSTDVKNYVDGLRRTYPPDKAAQLLESVRGNKQPPTPAAAPSAAVLEPKSVVTMQGPPPEPMKIFGFQPETHAPQLAVPTGNGSRAAALPLKQKPKWADPAAPTSWRSTSSDVDRPEETAGAWIATGLFWILLSAGVALAVYTLSGPFLSI